MNKPSDDQIRGYVFGSAFGDALGQPVEFYDLSMIKRTFGEDGIQELSNAAFWTDDTQMMIALANALLKSYNQSVEYIMGEVTNEFIAWNEDPGHAPGGTCLRAVGNLIRGMNWKEAGVRESKGCGSVMRSGIVGLIYHDDLIKTKEVASASGRITHGHKTADAAAIAGALAIHYAVNGIHPKDMKDRILEGTKGISDEFTGKVEQAYELAFSNRTDVDCLEELGNGWIAEEAFAMSYFCCLRYPDDYLVAIRAGVNIGGDSDSVGCITGGILGAYLGYDKLPIHWKERMRNVEKLDILVMEIVELFSKLLNDN